MWPVRSVIRILLGSPSFVVLINPEGLNLIGAGVASPGRAALVLHRENALKEAAQGEHRPKPHYAGLPARARQHDKVKAEYARLNHTLSVVTRERDLAVQEKHQLQAKLENLEQVLKDSLAVLAGDKRHTRSVHFERAQYSERLQRCGLGGRPGGEAQRPTVLAAVHPRPEGSFWSLAGTAATGKPGEVNGVPQIHIHPEPSSRERVKTCGAHPTSVVRLQSQPTGTSYEAVSSVWSREHPGGFPGAPGWPHTRSSTVDDLAQCVLWPLGGAGKVGGESERGAGRGDPGYRSLRGTRLTHLSPAQHMREAAERRQQLELEHEQALAVLSAKQQEIDLLQKCKVRELEEKCRAQSEQFSLLSRDLEEFRQHAGKIDLGGSSAAPSDSPSSPSKPFPRLMNGLAPPISKGQESSIRSHAVIGDYVRPLPLPGDKPEPLSVKPTFLSRSGGPRCRFESDPLLVFLSCLLPFSAIDLSSLTLLRARTWAPCARAGGVLLVQKDCELVST
ncbi:hypothetical protein CB1_002061002 [Camelus ferus]|nr:hypothetical protein CB1_002061002 [Camelus ferus]